LGGRSIVQGKDCGKRFWYKASKEVVAKKKKKVKDTGPPGHKGGQAKGGEGGEKRGNKDFEAK